MILPLKKVFALGVAVVLLGAIIVYGMGYLGGRESVSSQAGPRASITSPPLEFSIELSKTEFQQTENITMRFCLKNIGNTTIRVIKRSMSVIDPRDGTVTEADGASIPDDPRGLSVLFHFGFCVTDSNGTEVYKLTEGKFQATYDIVLEPNGYVKQTRVWNYYYIYGSSLPKGTYQIRGIFKSLETPSIAFMIM